MLCLSSSLLWLLVTINTNHSHRAWIVKFCCFFFKEKEIVLVWDPYIFLGSPVSLHDCKTMRTNHTETWVSWSLALWWNQSVRKTENVIWVSFHSCIHSLICSFIKCLVNWLNHSGPNELCSLPSHSSEPSRWQWGWVYWGGWQRHMHKSLWPKKEEKIHSQESHKEKAKKQKLLILPKFKKGVMNTMAFKQGLKEIKKAHANMSHIQGGEKTGLQEKIEFGLSWWKLTLIKCFPVTATGRFLR